MKTLRLPIVVRMAGIFGLLAVFLFSFSIVVMPVCAAEPTTQPAAHEDCHGHSNNTSTAPVNKSECCGTMACCHALPALPLAWQPTTSIDNIDLPAVTTSFVLTNLAYDIERPPRAEHA